MLARTLQTLFYIAYPAVVYFGYQYLPTRQLGLLLLALYGATVLLNLRGSIQQLGAIIRQHVPLVGLILGATAFDNSTLLLFLPMVVMARSEGYGAKPDKFWDHIPRSLRLA